MVFAGSAVRFSGATREFACPVCGGLVFGGRVGRDDSFTIYAGSLDDPSLFRPQVAIFTRGRPEWAVIPAGLKVYAGLPG